jgi:hypothetical protein
MIDSFFMKMRVTYYAGRVPASASSRREGWDRKEERLRGGDYSTVKSAQRLSATLSILPGGREQIIVM